MPQVLGKNGSILAYNNEAFSPNGGTELPETTNLLKGDGAGGAAAATPGVDYVPASASGDLDIAASGNISILSGGDIALETEPGNFLTYNGSEVAKVSQIPTQLSNLAGDSTHRTVTDAQIQLFETVSQKYEKPSTGIPKTDLASGVIPTFKVDPNEAIYKIDNHSIAAEYDADGNEISVRYATKSETNAKYTKPSGGIPKTDLASGVQTSLGKADNALQPSALNSYRTSSAQDTIDNAQNTAINAKYAKPSGGIPASDLASGVIPTALSQLSEDSTHRTVTDAEKTTWNGKQNALGFTPENSSNKVTSISSSSTDTQYPSAKAVYAYIQSLNGNGVSY